MVKPGAGAPETPLLWLWPWLCDKALSSAAAAALAGRLSSSLGDWASSSVLFLSVWFILMAFKISHKWICAVNTPTDADIWEGCSSYLFWFDCRSSSIRLPTAPNSPNFIRWRWPRRAPTRIWGSNWPYGWTNPRTWNTAGEPHNPAFPQFFISLSSCGLISISVHGEVLPSQLRPLADI